ncbi:MAG TPA: GNAT family N-acetyltransferase [Opitutaceae bacterium]|nr:GNAT family N-acetyltransferase [Opitutaceae bacterium]
MTSENVTLREVVPSDLEVFYVQQLDPDANWMAAFVGPDPTDRAAFDTHWAKILGAPRITQRTILAEGEVAGHIACFPAEGRMEVTYWLGRGFWGRGIATLALANLLRLVTVRPLFGRAAADNIGSLRVLQKCGFRVVGTDKGFAHGRRAETEEFILRLDA